MSGARHIFATIRLLAERARRVVPAVLFLIAGLVSGSAFANPCTSAIDAAERQYGIPSRLLLAIAITESGVNGIPHPWTVHVAGRAIYASSQAAAGKYLRDAKGRLRANAFAGCMQLSVRYHRANFPSPEQMLNPGANVAYAARFLTLFKEDYGTWGQAIVHYQGGKPRQQLAYLCRVWRTLAALEPTSLRELETTRCGALPQVLYLEPLPVSTTTEPEDEDAQLQARLNRRELT
ncbi:MAG: transglycosylase SLT domain-containing protein [Proteobacteria bacterium]|nr:transglycosylase SLT domain-containing protein [Pseudomonadota bacterium]MBI3495714.1 transglycosylase SLT domain-containing protein [Pseudomonadota bacterium]